MFSSFYFISSYTPKGFIFFPLPLIYYQAALKLWSVLREFHPQKSHVDSFKMWK